MNIDKKMQDIRPKFKITKVDGGTITEYCNIVNPAEKTIDEKAYARAPRIKIEVL